ncbi:hypothetical protein HDV06_004861 [Boothiomyces sp. JEL0866]|nr:hypothetical protein HDV06_004861 [Boothiomyces sp. JEL0866]
MATVEQVENLLLEVKYYPLDLDMTVFQAKEFFDQNTFQLPYIPPITRSDIKPGIYDANTVLKSVTKINANIPIETQPHLLELWAKYAENREAMIHEYILKWNEERKLHYELSFFEPEIFSCQKLDHQKVNEMKKLELVFQIKFISSLAEHFGAELPSSSLQFIDGVNNGFDKDQLLNIFKPRVPESVYIKEFAAHVDCVNQTEEIDPLLKKKLMVKSNLSLDQINSWVQDRLCFKAFIQDASFLPLVIDIPTGDNEDEIPLVMRERSIPIASTRIIDFTDCDYFIKFITHFLGNIIE